MPIILYIFFYLWIDGKGFLRLAHTQEVIDDLLHGKVQSFLEESTKRDSIVCVAELCLMAHNSHSLVHTST